MSFTTQSIDIVCPYCGESFELLVDPSVDEQDYIEDCYVCCRPIHLGVVCDEASGTISVLARDENEC